MRILPLLGWLCMAGCRQNPDRPGNGAALVQQFADSARAAAVAYYEVGSRPRAVAAADFDGDGHVDVAVANAGSATVSILRGDGTGRLQRADAFTAGREPTDIDAADLDRDGDVDLVIANHETSGITVLHNNGRGRFAPARGSPFETGARPHLHGLATADFDGDGWTDVAVESADTKEVRILRGTAGGFSPATAVGVGAMPYWRIGVGVLSNRPAILVPGHGDSSLRVVQIDGSALRVRTLVNRLQAQPWMVVAGDVDSDGAEDVAVVETDAVSIWLARDGRFVAHESRLRIPGATEVATGDLDGDGSADLAIGPWLGAEVVVVSRGARTTRRVTMCERPVGLAIADLDADGRGELLATCSTGNQLAIANVAADAGRASTRKPDSADLPYRAGVRFDPMAVRPGARIGSLVLESIDARRALNGLSDGVNSAQLLRGERISGVPPTGSPRR